MTSATTTPARRAAVQADIVYGGKPSVGSRGLVCDRCPTARARARALFETGPLYLCGHHLRTGWDTIIDTALEVSIDLPEDRFYLPASPTAAPAVAGT